MSEGLWGQFAKRRKVSAKLDTVHNASVCKQPPNADLDTLILAFARVSASVISTNILNPTNAAMRLCFFMPLLSYVQAHAKTA